MQCHTLVNKLRLFVFLFMAVHTVNFGQSQSVQQLEERVYQLNNQLRYNESQALLLPLLQDESLSNDYKYQVAILVSYTYKRVFDYQSTLKFLDLALKFAGETTKKRAYTANIQSEQAFVFFDIHQYDKSDSVMNTLERAGFNYIDLENKSKLIMQQGYLLFLKRQYAMADATYERAIGWMAASNPCDLPMIYVKKMQLYNAMNRLDLLGNALKKSSFYADSCKIIKYHLYAHEELLAIYEGRNDLALIAETKKKLDSLNRIYARDENISSLHNQRENILLENKDREIKRAQISKGYLVVVSALLFLVVLALVGWLFFYRTKQRKMDTEFVRMKSELEAYLASDKMASPEKLPALKEQINALSERQREVLACLAKGMPNKIIADRLCISENTVKYHIKNIYQLLHIRDRKDLLVNMRK